MEILTDDVLASWLEVSVTPRLQQLVALTNDLVTEAWANPVDPVPTKVLGIALGVGGRAYWNPKGLSSWSRSVDDASRTERLPDDTARAGVFLTDAERRALAGGSASRRQRMGTIKLHVPGWTRGVR